MKKKCGSCEQMVNNEKGQYEKHFIACKVYSKYFKKSTSGTFKFECTECSARYRERLHMLGHIKEKHLVKKTVIKPAEIEEKNYKNFKLKGTEIKPTKEEKKDEDFKVKKSIKNIGNSASGRVTRSKANLEEKENSKGTMIFDKLLSFM